MTLYRKRPVTIEALQFDGTEASGVGIAVWAGSHGGDVSYRPIRYTDTSTRPNGEVVSFERKTALAAHLKIETLEGAMTASKGDYVIRGLKGEFYPCKSDIFAASYEPLIGAAL